ncbi:ATP-binding protein [Vibrio cholerae]|uniref:ATP-binding protein n=2 Tax=Vibrio cholerae TaxID=666 RepID=UPI001D9616C6|nr:ATP-binding protein [Vibrio cholerae]EGQ8314621.1 ATP-binding protein [Vibrio cholerae]EGR4254551.1 ATP-binding protein [Vibrio cholerae]EKF9746713.1 ATP-binding protein [Vibrio cholerae]MDV2339640.1 ATP-binding protein [Vibrio cholerae]
MNNKYQLKKELLELINNSDDEKLEYGKILEVAAELSTYDEENARFSVDGNLVKRLGEQLVAKKTTALAELIKNAYDADADKVDVIFDNTEQPGGTVTIVDNGNGMTKEALLKGFMKISTTDKEDDPVSPLYERARAGRKGIGRFSAQKIGNSLRIVTRTSESDPFLILDIHWNDYKGSSNLLSINNSIFESYDDFGFEKGTKLIISDTKEAWTENHLATTFRYIRSIIKITPKTLGSGVVDPGFNTYFYSKIPLSGELLLIESADADINAEADAIIEAFVNGNNEVNIIINGVRLSSVNESYTLSEVKPRSLGQANFKLTAHYFTLAKGTKRAHIQTFLRENGGIRLYRNGFYVAPYGSRGNDWIGLDDSSRRRLILGPHANTNFIGSVEIVDTEGSMFEETSSREGLIENEYFFELQEILYQIIRDAVNKLTSARGRKVSSSQQGYVAPEKTIEQKLQESFSKIQHVLTDQKDGSISDENLDFFTENETYNSKAFSANLLNEEAKKIIEEQIELVQELSDEKNMYRVLASTGLAIAEFTHEIQLYLDGLMLNGKQLKRHIDGNVKALSSAENINSNIDMLVAYTDYFTETIRNNAQRSKKVMELRDVINTFFYAMEPTLKRRAYEFYKEFEGDEFWIKPMHISEVSSILMNLFTNSCKAIIRSGKKNGKLKISVSTTENEHIIRFEDNGDGIPKENWGKVFNPLFTTDISEGPFATDREQLKGMGLGLTITNDIVTEVDGDVSVVEATSGYSTCIQVILPKAEECEIPKNAY